MQSYARQYESYCVAQDVHYISGIQERHGCLVSMDNHWIDTWYYCAEVILYLVVKTLWQPGNVQEYLRLAPFAPAPPAEGSDTPRYDSESSD